MAAQFNKYKYTAAAKTGTAEVAGKEDMAWFSCYAPYEEPRFALTVCVEEGGSGGAVGAPMAAEIMNAAIASLDDSIKEKMTVISATEVSSNASDE